MDKSLEQFIKLVRQSTRFVNRDFFELEAMQAGAKKSREFAEKTCQRVAECYVESLSKYYQNLIFTTADLEAKEIKQDAILIEIMDGFDNLTKSLPYFASIATKVVRKGDKIIPEQSVMVMHGSNKIYYALSGGGAWREDLYGAAEGKIRLRVASSNAKSAKNLVVGTSYSNINLATKFSENIRIFGSDAFLCAMVASGKLDLAILAKNQLTSPAYKLFIKECGGIIIEDGDVLIATNVDMQTTINKPL